MSQVNVMGKTLSQMGQTLQLGETPDTTELRGNDFTLYVKQRKHIFSSESARTTHRCAALRYVQSGFQNEFNISDTKIQRVLSNIFGAEHVPRTQIHVGEFRTLTQLASSIQQIKATSPDITGLKACERALSGNLKTWLEQEGIPRDLSQDWACYALAMNNKGIAPNEACDHAVQLFRERTAAVGHNVTLAETGEWLRANAASLPAFSDDSCTTTQKAEWLNLARSFGALAASGCLPAMPLSHRISFHEALVDDAHGKNGTQQYGEAVRLLSLANYAFSVADIQPASESQRMAEYMNEIGPQSFVEQIQDTWTYFSLEDKLNNITILVHTHATAFDYTVPYITTSNDDFGPIGSFNGERNELTINISKKEFSSYKDVIAVVTHECTHAYQHSLTNKFTSRSIIGTDDRYDQARLLASNKKEPLIRANLNMNGLRDHESYDAYRHAPNETHAYSRGDEARAHFFPEPIQPAN